MTRPDPPSRAAVGGAFYRDEWLTVLEGDCREVMAGMPAESVHCVVTSPPYWGLRDYGTATWEGGDADCDHKAPSRFDYPLNAGLGPTGAQRQDSNVGIGSVQQFRAVCGKCGATRIDAQLGLEPTPEAYVAALVEVFRAVRRVLRADGTVWLNLGDSYAGTPVGAFNGGGFKDGSAQTGGRDMSGVATSGTLDKLRGSGLKPKDRVMIPARVALALQADGWWLRDEIVWSKPNPMPSSVADRTTPAHEMIYLLTRSARYAYDGKAIAEPMAESSVARINQPTFDTQTGGPKDYANGTNPNQSARKALENLAKRRTPAGWNVNHDLPNNVGRYRQRDKQAEMAATVPTATAHTQAGFNDRWDDSEADGSAPLTRNKRSVWTVPTEPYPAAHFATFPQALIEPMILAGCPVGGTVLDPFAGSGTVGLVAQRHGRRAVLIDLNAEYLRQCLERNRQMPLGVA